MTEQTKDKLRLAISITALVCSIPLCVLPFTGCTSEADPTPAQSAVSSGTTLTDSIIDLTGIPQSLQEKLENYPECIEFVEHYAEEHDKEHVIDISGEYTPGQIPLFIQWDIRWGYALYGDDMLGINGCGPTCLSMVLVGLTGNTAMDPLTVANFAEENGYYCQGAGSYFSLLSAGAAQLGLYSEEVPLDETTIRDYLDRGQPIICYVTEGDFTVGGHFIVLTGVNSDGTVNVNDPNSRKNSEKTWELPQIMKQTQYLWAYSLQYES